MKLASISHRITMTGLTVLLKAFVCGLLLAEAWRFGQLAAVPYVEYTKNGNYETAIWIVTGGLTIIIMIYSYCRRGFVRMRQLFLSARFDLAVSVLIGIVVSRSFGGIGAGWYNNLFSSVTLWQHTLIFSLPVIFGILIMTRALAAGIGRSNERYASFFLSDIEKQHKDEDLLNFTEAAERFAERVFNGGSPESIVFGIDAPWGIGKSTFVNFCQEYWNSAQQDQVIVYKFNPLRYEDRSNLLEKFVDGLVHSIQRHVFLPEIRPLISRYSRLIKGKGTISLGALSLDILLGPYTVDDAFKDLEMALGCLDRKIIVVVDDLDRLGFSAIKDVLIVIKKSFTLPNISYVLCYDTDNIASLERINVDPDKITEFLEKFVNVKVSLFLDNQVLEKFISDNLKLSLSGNSQADPLLIGKAVDGLRDIYKSPKFHEYIPFIGDVRKIKRLLNTLMLLEVEQTDFSNSDFDKFDLTHLLLIYINYPNVFRKIYSAETSGGRGFFSAVAPYDDHYPEDEGQKTLQHENSEYKNSTLYRDFVKSLPPMPKFLLSQVFDLTERLESTQINLVPEVARHTFACFNGGRGMGRNLEAYLHLIVKLSKPQRRSQYTFYLKAKEKIQAGDSISDILAVPEFAVEENEDSHAQFWRLIVNSRHDFSVEVGGRLINYLIDNFGRYSYLSIETLNIGLRENLDYFLAKMLDTFGWEDQGGGNVNNNNENVQGIARWIFGEDEHRGDGVLDRLSAPDRGVLGFFDLMSFRLVCCADRGGDIFNLSRALSLHGDPNAPIQGSVRDIVVEEMREISQSVFHIFKTQYIDCNINLFALIDSLELADFCGDWNGFVETKINEKVVTAEEIENRVLQMKTRIKIFIIYQLANTNISNGIGCGYYDSEGTDDKNGIAKSVNRYLFDYCFNPKFDKYNYEHFLMFVMSTFERILSPARNWAFALSEDFLTKVFDQQMFAKYWIDHADAIRSENFQLKDKIIVTSNYTASYTNDLENIYSKLDTFVARIRAETNEPPVAEVEGHLT